MPVITDRAGIYPVFLAVLLTTPPAAFIQGFLSLFLGKRPLVTFHGPGLW